MLGKYFVQKYFNQFLQKLFYYHKSFGNEKDKKLRS